MNAEFHASAATPAVRHLTAAGDRDGSWPAFLSDLACLGRVWVETESPALTLAHRTALPGGGVRAGIGHAQGPDFALRLLLEHCHALTPLPPPCGSAARRPESIVVEDRLRRPVLALRAQSDADPTGLLMRALLRAHGAVGSRSSVPAPYRPAPLRGLRALPEHAADGLAHRCAALADDIALVDHAELSGQLALHPRRLRDRGHAAGVDPDLVPCALDTLAEQVVPIRIVVGNEAVVRRVDAAFFASRRGLDWQYLRADHVTLRLDTRAVDSAWVFQPSDLPAAPRQLRLYDRDGLAIAVLSPAPRDGHGEHHIWTTLIDALLQ